MVGVGRIELPTPAMSTQCSTTELYAHSVAVLPTGSSRKAGASPSDGFRAVQAQSTGYEKIPGTISRDLSFETYRSRLATLSSKSRSTSRTRSRRWKGLDNTRACGASRLAFIVTAAKPVMNMTLVDGDTFAQR